MKKIVASVGLAALGASGLQTASAQDLVGPDTSKPWSVGVTLRGFYDDNPSTTPNDVSMKTRDSFGFEVSPTAALAWSMQQTTINLGLMYSLKYYDTVPSYANGLPAGFTEHSDQTFSFNAGLTHAFSEQVKARVSDSFVIGQEPDVLRAGNTFSTFQRVSGDNIRNYGTVALDAQLTPVWGLGFGYDNAFYDYKASGAALPTVPLVPVTPSLSGILDRIEHRAHLEGTYQVAPQTKLLLGYQYTEIDYTGDEFISGYFGIPGFIPTTLVKSDFRDVRDHTVYVGAEQTFTPDLTASARVGGTYSDYFNDPTSEKKWTPYANASLKYTYMPESYVQGGISYDRNATDLVGSGGAGHMVMDAESVVVFASVNHRFDPRFFGSLLAQFQNSTYNGGFANNESEQYYLVGLDLEYKFNAYFSGHVGYNYDLLESDLGRKFDRNRVYIGVTASY
jgi:Putative beta-barrel porin 2